MRSLLLASTLLLTTFAEVEVLSINLKGWQNCNNDQVAKISSAWENAIKMAAALNGKIDFNEAAAVEYLGPPAFTGEYAQRIRDVYESTATFGQGSKWVPTPFKWDAYVRCDDWKGNCARSPNTKAYTKNRMGGPDGNPPKSDSEREHSTPIINFCQGFFRMGSFADKVQEAKDLGITQKFNLDYYTRNRDSVVLHELMHADVVTHWANGRRHIADMMFKLQGEAKFKRAYEPANAKLFTRVEEVYGGGWVTQNADSFSLYALAKATQKALGNKYPYLPRPAKGEFDDDLQRKWPPHPAPSLLQNGKLSWVENSEGFLLDEGFETERPCSAEEDTDECPPIIEGSKLLNSSMYPKEYLEQMEIWIDEISDAKFEKIPEQLSTTDTPVPGNPSQKCNFDHVFTDLPVVPIDTDIAKAKIVEVCKLFNDITLDSEKQRDIQMHYDGVGVEILPWAAWNAGNPQCISRGSGKITEQHCVDMFNKLINDCPNDDPIKTYGGSKVDKCIVYGFDVRKMFNIGV